MPVLGCDRRSSWKANVMPDTRVTHLWDERRVTGPYFAQHLPDGQDFVWDTYILYGGAAHWDDGPAPVRSSGYTVIRKREELQKSILPLLEK